MSRLPLTGIRVIDASAVLMGPYASQWLADFGAEVIKVEPPEGDSTRQTGPTTERGMSPVFLGVNRNKKKHRHRPEKARWPGRDASASFVQ